MDILEALNISLTGFVVVLIILALLAVIIVILSKIVRSVEGLANKKDDNIEVSADSPVASATVASAPVSTAPAMVPVSYGNYVELYKTDEKSAATIMAIVSHESGIPLNRLQFTSIRLIDNVELYKTDDKTAATIMAIVSHQSGIPLDRLLFKSIKLIEN